MTEFPVKELTFITGERPYVGFDFSPSPEVVAGETLSSPTIPDVPGLTIEAPTVLAATFDGIATGKGTKARITMTAAGSYIVVCTCTTSGGAERKVPIRLIVADLPTS